MSKNLFDSLSEAQIAALQQIFTNDGEAVENSPKAKDPNRPVVKASGFELIRCLNGYAVPDDEVVFVEDDAQYWGDDTPITFGDLRFVVEGGATKADGTKCRDYPNVWALSQAQCSAAITTAKTFSAKPKNTGKFSAKPKNSVQPKADDARMDRLEALVMQLAEGQFREPAKPVAAKPVAAKPQRTTPANITLKPGDVIWLVLDGVEVSRQISADGKRLNATIV